MKKLFLFFLGACVSCGTFAQRQATQPSKASQDAMNQVLTIYQDSLQKTVDKYANVLADSDQLDPFMYQFMSGNTYYNNPLHQAFSMDADTTQTEGVDLVMMATYLAHPERYQRTESQLEDVRVISDIPAAVNQPKVKVSNMVQVEKPTAEVGDIDPVADKPKFWKHNANIYFQFSQSHVSDNWYKGGESANTLLAGMTLEANYNDQRKVQWDNKLELKVGFISSAADSLHKFKTNTDLFRMSSKFGYKARANWYYTLLAELENQMFPGYKNNDATVYSQFLSPLKFNASLGLDLKRKKENKYELSLALLPGSMNLWYIHDDDIAVNQFGYEPDQHFNIKVGSRLQLDHTLFFAKNIKWVSHFYVFTSYDSTEGQWENTLDFQVNKVLSAKIFVNTRYDDAVTGKDLQVNESLSFGLSYTL